MTIQPHSSSVRGLTIPPSNINTDCGMPSDQYMGSQGNTGSIFASSLFVALICLTILWIVALVCLTLSVRGSCLFPARVHDIEEQQEPGRQSEDEPKIVQRRDRKEYIERMLVIKKLDVRVPKDLKDNYAESPDGSEEHDTTTTAASHDDTSRRRRSLGNKKIIFVLENLDVFRTCPICLCEYTDGDTLCWSHNQTCRHTFHQSCAEAWVMKHDRCPCCRANYRTTPVVSGGGGANHHDDEDVPPRILTNNSSNYEQGQEQPSREEPILLPRNLRSVLDRQCKRVSRSLEDSGYSSDVSEENGSRRTPRNRRSNDATGDASEDDLESQRSERHQIELTSNPVVQGSSSVEYFDCGRKNTTKALDERHPDVSDYPATWRELHNDPVTNSMRDVLSLLSEMKRTKSDCNIRYSSQ